MTRNEIQPFLSQLVRIHYIGPLGDPIETTATITSIMSRKIFIKVYDLDSLMPVEYGDILDVKQARKNGYSSKTLK